MCVVLSHPSKLKHIPCPHFLSPVHKMSTLCQRSERGRVPLEIKTPMGFTQPCRSQLSHPGCKLTTAVSSILMRGKSPSVPWEKGSQVVMFSPRGISQPAQLPQDRACPPCESPMHHGRGSEGEVVADVWRPIIWKNPRCFHQNIPFPQSKCQCGEERKFTHSTNIYRVCTVCQVLLRYLGCISKQNRPPNPHLCKAFIPVGERGNKQKHKVIIQEVKR